MNKETLIAMNTGESMTDLDRIFSEAETGSGVRIHERACMLTSAIVFQQELLKACESCGRYNKSWTCPPACESMEKQREKILSYKNACVFTTKHELDDSFDFEGMTLGMEKHISLLIEIKNRIKGDHPVYGAGTCPVCKGNDGGEFCAFPNPCPFPEKRISSIESAGVNVTELSIAAGIKYNNGKNTVTYFSVVLF
jgi:predicted metal-binding protein